MYIRVYAIKLHVIDVGDLDSVQRFPQCIAWNEMFEDAFLERNAEMDGNWKIELSSSSHFIMFFPPIN